MSSGSERHLEFVKKNKAMKVSSWQFCHALFTNYIWLKHGISADQDFFMLYHWYRKNIHDMNKFHKLSRLTFTYLNLLKISRC